MVADWDLACTAGFNLCLIGKGQTTKALIDELSPRLSRPVITLWSGASLELPVVGEPVGTVMLFDVETLTLTDQSQLMAWLSQTDVLPRVISTSLGSVLPMISAGIFLAPLYYRLNTICLDLRQVEASAIRSEVPLHHRRPIGAALPV
jgi:hypothetical protein